MGKTTICIGANKGADQLRSDYEADQRLCFHHMVTTISLLSKSEISCLQPSSVLVQFGLCQTWSETTLLVFHKVAHLVSKYTICDILYCHYWNLLVLLYIHVFPRKNDRMFVIFNF